MRWLSVALVGLLVLIQYPLWIGKGGWLRVWEVDRQLTLQREANRKLVVRNAGLDAEVRDLKTGYDAIEERARYELGMIKQDEVFVQIPERTPGERPVPRGEKAEKADKGERAERAATPRSESGTRSPAQRPARVP